MPMHEHHSPTEPVEVDASLGYEGSDVRVSRVVVFLTALSIFVVVTAVLCIGIGKVINSQIAKADGPVSKWSHPVDVRNLGNLPNSPALQQQFQTLANRFPTPRLQNDDGYEEVYEMHQREDLLLENYSYIDRGAGTVRIPIDRAMELIAQRGLPVAPGAKAAHEPLGEQGAAAQSPTTGRPMAGVEPVTVTAPLTDGFARTAYEQQVDEERHQRLESREAMQEHEQQEKQGAKQ